MNEQENITHKDCKAWCHNSVGSPHPKNKVPIKEFEKPTKHPLVPYFQNCKDCRNYLNNSAKKLKNEKDKKLEEEKQKLLDIGDTSHKVCTDRNHHISGSIYPYNNVPEIKFRKYPDDPKSHHLKTCLECRTYDTEKSKKLTTFKQERAKEKEKFYCIECYIEKDLSERGKNLDGTFSSSCKDCKINKYPGRENIKTIKAKIKTEFIKKQGSCCDVCNKFFIKEPQNNPPFKELQMEIININLDFLKNIQTFSLSSKKNDF